MRWNDPPLPKVYEALTALADGRVVLDPEDSRRATCRSSSGGKTYEVWYDADKGVMTSNDNAAYYTRTLSYPMIAVLLARGAVSLDASLLPAMRGIVWKDINRAFRNNYAKAAEYVLARIEQSGRDMARIRQEAERIREAAASLNLSSASRTLRPPKGW